MIPFKNIIGDKNKQTNEENGLKKGDLELSDIAITLIPLSFNSSPSWKFRGPFPQITTFFPGETFCDLVKICNAPVVKTFGKCQPFTK